MFKDLIRQKEHMVLPDLAQDLAQVLPLSLLFLVMLHMRRLAICCVHAHPGCLVAAQLHQMYIHYMHVHRRL